MTIRAVYKVLVIGLLIVFLLTIAACSTLLRENPEKRTPTLADINLGQDYEIQQISGYPSQTLTYIGANDTYIVSTRLRTSGWFSPWQHFWRISNTGELLDSFATELFDTFLSSGTYFSKYWYNDWPLTGDKDNKAYERIIYARDIDNKLLEEVLKTSPHILWDEVSVYEKNESRREFHFYVENNGLWSLLISEERLFEHPQYADFVFSRTRYFRDDQIGFENPASDEDTSGRHPLINIPWAEAQFSFKQRSADAISFVRFKKSHSVRPSLFSEQGWTGKVGRGLYRLNLDQQTFDFQTYTRAIPRTEYEEYFPDMRLAHSLGSAPSSFLLLHLSTSGGGNARLDPEAGIYIIRRKSSLGREFQQQVKHIAFKDFEPMKPVLRWLSDASGQREDWSENENIRRIDLPVSITSFPVYLDFYFRLSDYPKQVPKFAVTIHDKTWQWEKTNAIYSIIYLDVDEMTAAAKELGGGELSLNIRANQQASTVELIFTLASSEAAVRLNNVRIASKKPK